MRNIYLIGHGVIMSTTVNGIEHFDKGRQLPQDIYVKFYCKKGARFDSIWEPFIMSNPNYSGELPPSFRGRGEEAWQVHKYSVVYPDHFLISPGNIKSREEKRVLLQIEVQMDGRSVHLPCISNGRDNAYFIERGRSYKCTLSAIITDLSQQGFKGIVHWLACSEICHNEDEMRELAEAIKIDKPTDVMKGETSVSAFRRMFEKK